MSYSIHESRLNAMLDANSLADWNLNEEDRAAIRWALDAICKLKAERDEIRNEYSQSLHRQMTKSREVHAALEQLNRAASGL